MLHEQDIQLIINITIYRHLEQCVIHFLTLLNKLEQTQILSRVCARVFTLLQEENSALYIYYNYLNFVPLQLSHLHTLYKSNYLLDVSH